jgi:hypothetical protein
MVPLVVPRGGRKKRLVTVAWRSGSILFFWLRNPKFAVFWET